MSSRLRSLSGPKTSFFAFQDIITSVTGVLILVTLMLASHIDQAAESQTSPPADLEHELRELLQDQTRLELEAVAQAQALAAAEAIPDLKQLRIETALLTARVDNENLNADQLRSEGDRRKEETRRRDERLGLADLNREVEKTRAVVAGLEQQDAKLRQAREAATQELKNLETALLKVRARKGEVWVLPESLNSSKEPILAVVSAGGLSLERFDQPDSRRVFPRLSTHDGLAAALKEYNPLNQYLVFYIRPSGISLFGELSKQARAAKFEIGYDAVDEKVVIHFSSAPTVDDLTKPPPPLPPAAGSPATISTATAGPGGSRAGSPASPTLPMQPALPSAAPPKPSTPTPSKPLPPPEPKLGWWRRLLRAIGLY